ncbi:hypothetical protein B484DRAFT_405447 [Ochromonadaceae sp. CCMP2298]|nr:hypothetical protein B484DRAFT_405447 [Ochromonadaceae sp. CCMP2298]
MERGFSNLLDGILPYLVDIKEYNLLSTAREEIERFRQALHTGGREQQPRVECEEQALAMNCSPELYALYQQARVQVQAAIERTVERLAAERRLAVLSERRECAHREDILTLKCPRCKAFLDFTACF